MPLKQFLFVLLCSLVLFTSFFDWRSHCYLDTFRFGEVAESPAPAALVAGVEEETIGWEPNSHHDNTKSDAENSQIQQIPKFHSVNSPNDLRFKFNIDDWEGLYDKETRLGHGDYGYVNKVTHMRYGFQYAVKKSYPSRGRKNETRILQELRYEDGIMKMFGYTTIEGVLPESKKGAKKSNDTLLTLYELMDGDLDKFVSLFHDDINITDSRYQKVVDKVASDFSRQIVRGLLAMNEHNYFHYDLKGGNVLYQKLPGDWEYRWVLSDFDGTKYLRDENGELIEYNYHGRKRPYRPPELCTSHLPVTGAVDLYALGVITFQIITNRYPFDGPTKSRHKGWEKTYYKNNKRIGDLDLCVECYEEVFMPANAKDFIDKLMKYDAKERMSLEDATKHRWLIKRHTTTLPSQVK